MKKYNKNIASIKNLQTVTIKKEMLAKVKGGHIGEHVIDGL